MNKDYSLKSFWVFLIPLIGSRILSYLYVIGDQAIIGRTSLEGYTAVSIAANLVYWITGSFGMLGPAFNILGSRSRDDKAFLEKLFGTGVTIALIMGVLFEAFCILFGRALLKGPFHLDGEALHLAYQYLLIVGLTFMLNIVTFLFSALVKVIGTTGAIFKSTLVSNLINLGLDYVLVFGKAGFPRLGVQGAAIGTLAGAIYPCCYYLFYCRKLGFFRFRLGINTSVIGKILRCYLPLLGQDIAEYTLFISVLMSLISKVGATSVSAYNVLYSLYNLVALVILSCGTAAVSYISSAFGRHSLAELKRVPVDATLVALALCTPMVAVIIAKPTFFISLITDNAAILTAATGSIMVFGFFTILNIPQQILRSALNAVGHGHTVLILNAASSFISLGVIAVLLRGHGFDAVMMGLVLNQVAMGVAFGVTYQRILQRVAKQEAVKLVG